MIINQKAIEELLKKINISKSEVFTFLADNGNHYSVTIEPLSRSVANESHRVRAGAISKYGSGQACQTCGGTGKM